MWGHNRLFGLGDAALHCGGAALAETGALGGSVAELSSSTGPPWRRVTVGEGTERRMRYVVYRFRATVLVAAYAILGDASYAASELSLRLVQKRGDKPLSDSSGTGTEPPPEVRDDEGHQGGKIIEQGTKVRLRPELFSYSRPHLLFHARQRDIGVVSPPSKQSPAMARLYTIVHFEQCGHDHRLLSEELEVVA